VDAEDIAVAAVAAAAAAGESLSKEHFRDDANVQAKVLAALGIYRDTTAGQRPLKPEELEGFILNKPETLVRQLHKRNSFDLSYMPVLKAMSGSGMWPLVMSRRQQGYLSELPTLELCAALCTRILCVARRLRSNGKTQLVVLGVGSGDALVEASIALCLGQVLGQQVSLHSKPPLVFRYGTIFRILLFASDTPDQKTRIVNHTSEVFGQMAIVPYGFEDATREFANEHISLFVFCSWAPETENWLKRIEECAGKHLVELCFLQPPCALRETSESDMLSPERRTTELFPKTLCRLDFLARGFDIGLAAGLHHSQLYVITKKWVPPPFLAQQLIHTMGSFRHRMNTDRRIEGVFLFHRVGLCYACCPEDLAKPLPQRILDGIKEMLYVTASGQEVADYRKHLRIAMKYAEGSALKQLSLLVENSTSRMYRPDPINEKVEDQRTAEAMSITGGPFGMPGMMNGMLSGMPPGMPGAMAPGGMPGVSVVAAVLHCTVGWSHRMNMRAPVAAAKAAEGQRRRRFQRVCCC